jgi:Universal stress protein family
VIVCGSRGRGDIVRSLLGSTSTSVLHHATRPVLVVSAEAAAREGPALIAYDGSPGARAAVGAAGRMLPRRDALVVHVWYSAIQHTPAAGDVSLKPTTERVASEGQACGCGGIEDGEASTSLAAVVLTAAPRTRPQATAWPSRQPRLSPPAGWNS